MMNNPWVNQVIRELSRGDLCRAKCDILTWKSLGKSFDPTLVRYYQIIRHDPEAEILKNRLFLISGIVYLDDRRFIEVVMNDGKTSLICETDFTYFCEKVK